MCDLCGVMRDFARWPRADVGCANSSSQLEPSNSLTLYPSGRYTCTARRIVCVCVCFGCIQCCCRFSIMLFLRRKCLDNEELMNFSGHKRESTNKPRIGLLIFVFPFQTRKLRSMLRARKLSHSREAQASSNKHHNKLERRPQIAMGEFRQRPRCCR